MAKQNDVVEGTVCNYLTVLNPKAAKRNGTWHAEVQCVCGTKKLVRLWNIQHGESKSCGCMKAKHSCPSFYTGRSMYDPNQVPVSKLEKALAALREMHNARIVG
jgi:hypothetical protein